MFEIGDKFLMWGMQGSARKQVLVTVVDGPRTRHGNQYVDVTLPDGTLTAVFRPARAWADGFGAWYAAVRDTYSARDRARMARQAVAYEISQHQEHQITWQQVALYLPGPPSPAAGWVTYAAKTPRAESMYPL